MTNRHKPFLHFDFNGYSTTFENPVEIITTYDIDQVIPSLVKIQDAIQNGYYAAGYVSYEAAQAFEHSMKVFQTNRMPLLWFGIYEDTSNVTDKSIGSFYTTDWKPNTSTKKYNRSINQIKTHIEHGDTYQVNYTIRMDADFLGDPFTYYQQLASSQSANYSAYLDIEGFNVLSASPELFFHLKEGKITTKPMKGTIGRGKTIEEDQENAKWLSQSEKNRAENVMIVDLLRNDLGKLAKPGSVKVPELFTIEEYPTVFQMTSTVTGEIDNKIGIVDIFNALFPCGSITGAPKISTMNIIHDLETTPREVYCGAIGFITPEREAIFNVPIRTVVIDDNGKATYGVGGGITWDSKEDEEYNEVLTKAKVLSNANNYFQLIETIGLFDGDYLVLDNHVRRLKRSASYFNYQFNQEQLMEKLYDIANRHPKGSFRVRVLLYQNGELSIDVTDEETVVNDGKPVSLAKQAVSQHDIFLYHKTTNRVLYEKLLGEVNDMFDVLLWNEHDEITEFTRGNVVVELAGKLYTPPVQSGLLAGTYREKLLNEGTISERVIRKEELAKCSKIWFINSVRQWVLVHLV